jgi:D-cysteine desulfhydrase
MTDTRPLFDVFPSLEEATPFARLGTFPTPISSLNDVAQALGSTRDDFYEKRDDKTSPIYGGNKVRTLEVLIGHALKQGCSHIFSTGAYGSNHAAAMAMHAPRVGLKAGVCVYPQPPSPSALENLELVLSRRPRPLVQDLPHWSALPYGIAKVALNSRLSGVPTSIMMPGGAVPLGALGYVSAAFELARQVEAGELPMPRRVVVAVGSNCTSAGLLLGLRLAADRGIGFPAGCEPPKLVSVRVTPWPVTIVRRIVGLARGTADLLADLTGDDSLRRSSEQLKSGLSLDTDYLGPGYGFATDVGREAVRLWAEHAGHPLETTYSAKAAARVVDGITRDEPGPTLFWVTKSSAVLDAVEPELLAWAPARMQRWMAKTRHVIS